jgi:hypothetical protein
MGTRPDRVSRDNIQGSSTPHFNSNVHFNSVPLEARNTGPLKLKPQNFSGNEDLEDYLTQCELIADLNSWNYSYHNLAYLISSTHLKVPKHPLPNY